MRDTISTGRLIERKIPGRSYNILSIFYHFRRKTCSRHTIFSLFFIRTSRLRLTSKILKTYEGLVHTYPVYLFDPLLFLCGFKNFHEHVTYSNQTCPSTPLIRIRSSIRTPLWLLSTVHAPSGVRVGDKSDNLAPRDTVTLVQRNGCRRLWNSPLSHGDHIVRILSGETKRALFYHAKPRSGNHGVRLGVVKQSFFGPPGQYGRRVTRVNNPKPEPENSGSGWITARAWGEQAVRNKKKPSGFALPWQRFTFHSLRQYTRV